MEIKEQIRAKLLYKRKQITEEEWTDAGESLAKLLKKQPLVQEHGYFYAYYPQGKELSLLPFLEWALDAGKRIALPRVRGEQMDFYEITDVSGLVKGSFGIMEPVGELRTAWEEAVCLIPGVGFTEAGTRIGHGKGYYDRYLQRHPRLKKVGIAYEQQLAESIPTEMTDIPMEYLATPKRWIDCDSRKE